AGWSLRRQQVWNAVVSYLRQQGLRSEEMPEAGSLVAPVGIALLRAHPLLTITGARLDPLRSELEFHLRCAPAHGCKDFLATMAVSPQLYQALPAKFFFAVQGSETKRFRYEISDPRSAGSSLIHPGELATLVVEGDGIRIVLRVVSLSRGALG